MPHLTPYARMFAACLLAALLCCPTAFAHSPSGNPFSLISTTVLDTSFVPKRRLLPGVGGDSLLVFVDTAVDADSLHTCYYLHNVQSGAKQALLVPSGSMVNTRVVECFIERERIILVHVLGIAVFGKNGDGQWSMSREYALEHPVLYALKAGNTIELWNDVMPARKLRTNFYCTTFDLARQEIVRTVVFPKPAGAYCMAIAPRNVLTRTANAIALADITSYSVRIYSADTLHCDTLVLRPSTWVQPEAFVLREKGTDKLPAIDSVARSFSLISRLTFLNDTALLVVWSVPSKLGEPAYCADVWSKKAGVWSAEQSGIPLAGAGSEQAYGLPFAPATPYYVYRNGVFYDIAEYPLDYRLDYIWASYADCAKEARRYFTANPLQYVLVARKVE